MQLAQGPTGRKWRARINPTPLYGDHIARALVEYTLVTVIYDMKTMTIFLWAGSEEAVNEIA